MAEAFAASKMIVCMHKHYSVEEWGAWADAHPDILQYVAVSSGTSDADFTKTSAILARVNVPFICLDVANGYSEYVSTPLWFVIFVHHFLKPIFVYIVALQFVSQVRRTREAHPTKTIIAGTFVCWYPLLGRFSFCCAIDCNCAPYVLMCILSFFFFLVPSFTLFCTYLFLTHR